jgi:hypothetical protein
VLLASRSSLVHQHVALAEEVEHGPRGHASTRHYRAQGLQTGQMTLSFRQECGLPATKLAEKPAIFESTTLQRLNQSIRRTKARQDIRTCTQMRSAARRSRETGWGLLLLAWFTGNVVVATLAWFLVSLFLK